MDDYESLSHSKWGANTMSCLFRLVRFSVLEETLRVFERRGARNNRASSIAS
jgi:hypothetical protein